jgi:hypothetical protein
MRIVFFCVLILAVGCNTKINSPKQETKKEVAIDYNLSNYEIVSGEKEKFFPYAVSKRQMIRETSQTWTNIFDFNKITKKDKRRGKFNYYARLVTDIIRDHQNTNYYKEFYLPNNRYTHILIASVIYRETALKHKTIGLKGEVGLMQVWGTALKRHKKKDVINSPKLGLKLGISWLAENIYDCNMNNKITKLDDWTGVLAYYGMGPRAKNDDGVCGTGYLFAKKRVKIAKTFAQLL